MSSNSLELLNRLQTLTQGLLEISVGGLEQQSIATVLKLADGVRSIAQIGEQFHAHIQTTLAAKLTSEKQQTTLKKSQMQLLQIVQHCKGEGQSTYLVKKLGSDLMQWELQFKKVLNMVEEIDARQTFQATCQGLHQQAQDFQQQAIASNLENQRKLELVRHLIELEKNLSAIEQRVESSSNGHEDQHQLDGIKQLIASMRSTYSFV